MAPGSQLRDAMGPRKGWFAREFSTFICLLEVGLLSCTLAPQQQVSWTEEWSSLRYTSALEGVVEGGCWVAAQGKAGLTDPSACCTGNFHNTR